MSCIVPLATEPPVVVPFTSERRALRQNLVTEDDEPLDNILAEKLQRLLVAILYSSWRPLPDTAAPDAPRRFMACANVGVFYTRRKPPIVPDVFISLDVTPNPAWLAAEHRSYYIWEFGKAPDVALEIISNATGGELTSKMSLYARLGVCYYIVFDPFHELWSDELLHVYELNASRRYQLRADNMMPGIDLGIRLWHDDLEGMTENWLRWCDLDGNLLLTGDERATQETARARHEAMRATQETARAVHAEAALEAERTARQQLEAELARLRAELNKRPYA